MVANVNTMMTDGGGGSAGTNDSFIVDGGGQSFEECASSYAAVAARMTQLIKDISDDFAGIDWTDDQGNSFQEAANTFKKESEKIPARLETNSKILDACSQGAVDLNALLQNSIDQAYGG